MGLQGAWERMTKTIEQHSMAHGQTPVLLMVSGGSDSVALAYLAARMVEAGALGPVAMMHVNHKLRGAASDADAAFVETLAAHLGIPLFMCDVDVATLVNCTGGNMEAVAREERYTAACQALESLCSHTGFPLEAGRIFTAHTADDRVENLFMRTIVGTGPGGFRAMEHCVTMRGCRVCRPLLEVGREDLRTYIRSVEAPATDGTGELWREDATNADTDHFRAFVRHNMIPLAKERNPRLLETLTRTMNLIAEEDDMLKRQAQDVLRVHANMTGSSVREGVLLAPELGAQPVPLLRRAIALVLDRMLGAGARVENASIEACVQGFGNAGYTTNIQGNLAVTYNKQGLRIEPMETLRARRKRG